MHSTWTLRVSTAFSAFAILLVGLLPLCGMAGEPSPVPAERLAQGWIALFDGSTLFGWQSSESKWEVADGSVAPSQSPSAILTTSQFGNFELAVDFRGAEDARAAVILRAAAGAKPGAAEGSYRVEIGPDKKLSSKENWQSLRIVADGRHFSVELNGKKTAGEDAVQAAGRGSIGLESTAGKIAFRNIQLKPLGLKSIFNGKDLTGWKTYPENKCVFTVTPEGWLRIKNGKGQLESEGQYADFTLQLEVFVNGKHLNSGVFFRSIPGEVWNGYESQIHNGYKDGDRTKPIDCGTGGIFRRQNARRVVADDREWFSKTIHADGPHMAVWVNGYQVSDWTDTRAPHANPRNGLRVKAGTFILQGHDATTDLFFRNFRVAKLPPR